MMGFGSANAKVGRDISHPSRHSGGDADSVLPGDRNDGMSTRSGQTPMSCERLFVCDHNSGCMALKVHAL